MLADFPLDFSSVDTRGFLAPPACACNFLSELFADVAAAFEFDFTLAPVDFFDELSTFEVLGWCLRPSAAVDVTSTSLSETVAAGCASILTVVAVPPDACF
jgi:hypothetical protein